jgi:hypothetical protein
MRIGFYWLKIKLQTLVPSSFLWLKVRIWFELSVHFSLGGHIWAIHVDVGRVADPHDFNADPDPAFHFNADTDTYTAFHFDADPDHDPIPHLSDANLRPFIYGPSSAPFEPPGLHCACTRPSTALFWVSKASEFWLWFGSGSSFLL